MSAQPAHGTAVARWSPAHGWRGAWIVGPPGAGKSDLALRLIGRGWRLVADDYAHLFASGGAAYAVCPETIAGRMEARGLGVLPVCALGMTRLVLAVEQTREAVERLPEAETFDAAGVLLPLLRVDGFQASAAEKVALRLGAL